MVPRQILDRVPVPGGGELELSRRGEDFLIQIDRHDLMSSRCHGSEEAMARLALEATGRGGAVRWLVGGLGMGFTLRACLHALDSCADGSRVVVAEVFEAVVAWNREVLGELAARPLDDPRTEVVVGDVYDLLAPGGDAFDAILLDVDNGPEAMTLASNDRLYRGQGLARLLNKLA
ncbi:MAG: spermidine synthase, partial [Acidobacteriota bacterium]